MQFQMKKIEESPLAKKRETEELQLGERQKETERECLAKEEVKKTGKKEIEQKRLEQKIEAAMIMCIVGSFMMRLVWNGRKGRKMGKKEKKENEKK